MLAGGRWSRILAVLNTFCGALSSGLYRPLPAGSTTAFNNSPQSAGNCPKTLCNAGVPAGKKKLQRRALPARRRRYKAQMHPFSEFWDSLAGVTNPNRIAFLPTFMTHTQKDQPTGLSNGCCANACSQVVKPAGKMPALQEERTWQSRAVLCWLLSGRIRLG